MSDRLTSTCVALTGMIIACFALDADASCAVYPRAKGTEVLSGNTRIRVATVLDKCGVLKLEKGDATVCYKSKDGPKCNELPLNIEWNGAAASSTTVQDTFAVVVTGAPLRRVGGASRMDESRDRVAGLPYGKILQPSGALRIPLTAPALGGQSVTFSISPAGAVSRPVFSTQAAPGSRAIDIPARVLTGAPRFVWTLTAGAETYKGQFSFAARDEAQEAEGELRRVDAETGLSEQTRTLWKVLIYDDLGLTFESERLQLELREGA